MEMVYMTPDSDSDSDEGRLAAHDIFSDEEEKEDSEGVKMTPVEKKTSDEQPKDELSAMMNLLRDDLTEDQTN